MEHLRALEGPDALRAIAEPHRLEILRRLLLGPQTISSLGAAMDRHPAWVRHHVKALETAGLVRMVEERTTRNFTEKFYVATAAAFTVSLLIRPGMGEESRLVALVSHDFAVELLAAEPGDRVHLAAAVTGSLEGLMGVRQGLADIAGCHLLDSETGQYNLPYVRHIFPDRDIVVVTVAHREQGLIVAKGNPLKLRDISDIAEREARFVNRNRGSGTRLWLDREFAARAIVAESVTGYDEVVDTHTEAAARVASGDADVAVGVSVAAQRFGLEFVPLFRERYDLIMPSEVHDTEEVARLVDRMHGSPFRRAVAKLSGYDSSETGDETLVSA